jgi:uncharacterized protein (DUF983 family)
MSAPGAAPRSGATLVLPRPAAAARVWGRALRLRCPQCGGGPVLRHWLALRETCGHCATRLDRGEPDHFLGGMMLNLVVAEGLFVLGLVGVFATTWPTPPWALLERVAPLLALVAPVLLYPVTRLVWLGMDHLVRPDSPAPVR